MTTVAHYHLDLHQMNIENLVLNGNLEEYVYMDRTCWIYQKVKRMHGVLM